MTALSDMLRRHPDLAGMPPLTDPFALERAVRRIQERWPEVVPSPREQDRDAILARLQRRLQTGNWKDARLSEVTAAARAAFDPDRRQRRQWNDVRRFLVEECAVSTRRGFTGCMASVYLESFQPGAEHTRDLAAVLGTAIDRLPARWRRLFANLPELLDPARGPQLLARRMSHAEEPFAMLQSAGLVTPHGTGFMDHAHRAFIQAMRERLQRPDRQAALQLFAWLAPDAVHVRQRDAELAIDALLEPWRDHDPEERYRILLIDRLTSAYGDPRVRRSAIWDAVRHRNVMFRWQVGATLDAFLDIVSEAEDSHMWAPRKRFWKQLNAEKLISEAWVALSPRGADIARRQAGLTGENALHEFGLQTAGGTRANTSLLIMRINGRIVVEGSHNYKIHIFPRNAKEAPALYRREYDCEEIRWSLSEKYKRAHIGDWQSWVRERI